MNELISDLNLSFKHDDAALPLSKTKFDLVDYTRRLIADVVNAPRAAGHNLSFDSEEKTL